MGMLLMLKEGKNLTIENNIGDLEPSFPIIDDQTVANGGFGIASFGITAFAKEEDRVA
tara:strand:+ start:200 stop:373 length:174 start_codon:yes stop_codon:yes gene_type:complete